MPKKPNAHKTTKARWHYTSTDLPTKLKENRSSIKIRRFVTPKSAIIR